MLIDRVIFIAATLMMLNLSVTRAQEPMSQPAKPAAEMDNPI